MAGMSGIECLEAIRGMPGGDQPKIILCTTNSEIEQIMLALEKGADEYIIKPFDDEVVRSKFALTGLLWVGAMAVPEPAAADARITRVLVVDDSGVVRGLISRALKADRHIHVVATAADGQAAVAAVARTPVDVVILDVEMPIMDGLTAIPLLLKASPGLKIVMASTLTAKKCASHPQSPVGRRGRLYPQAHRHIGDAQRLQLQP